MSNKYHNSDTVTSKQSGGQGGSNEPAGSGNEGPGEDSVPQPPMKTAAWPGLPGKTQRSRAGGAPTKGHVGPFRVKSQGI